jgi:hypothetical protein
MVASATYGVSFRSLTGAGAIVIATGAVIGACATPYNESDTGVVAPGSDGGGGRSEAGEPGPGGGGGADAGGDGAGPSACAGTFLCLHFDGADPPGVNVQSGGTVDTTNDAVSPPSALRATAKSGQFAGFQWATAEKFGASSVVSLRLSFKITSLGTATTLPLIAFLKLGTTFQVNVGLKPNTTDVLLIWTDASNEEVGRGTLGKYEPAAWNVVEFTVSGGGASRASTSEILAPSPGLLVGDLGFATGAVTYNASDGTPFTILIDAVTATVVAR